MIHFIQLDPQHDLWIGASPGPHQSRIIVIRSGTVHPDDIWEVVDGTRILIVGVSARLALRALLRTHGRPELNDRTTTREFPNGVFSGATYTRLRQYLDL